MSPSTTAAENEGALFLDNWQCSELPLAHLYDFTERKHLTSY